MLVLAIRPSSQGKRPPTFPGRTTAHQTIHAEQDTWTSISQLADEYETIAQTAQHDRYATLLRNSHLDTEQANTIIDGESFGTLIAQLRRTQADGHDPATALARALRAGTLTGAENPAAVIAARIAKHATARPAGTRRRRKPDYITGLIPHARGPMPADMHHTLTELATLIEERADTLTQHAINEHEPWAESLGPPPADPSQHDAWQQQLRTIAAYRDRYKLTGSDPLGDAPDSQGGRLDYQRATLAAQQATTLPDRGNARRTSQRRHTHADRSLSL